MDHADAFGVELALDLGGCDKELFTRYDIKEFMIKFCDIIEMTREDLYFWDDTDIPQEECRTPPELRGISAVQFILTSNITIHTLNQSGNIFLNVFSCKLFNMDEAIKFAVKFFKATKHRGTYFQRGI